MTPKRGDFTCLQTKRIKRIKQTLLYSDSLSAEHGAAAEQQWEAAEMRAASIKRFLSGPCPRHNQTTHMPLLYR
jgi:hypothetical protein